MARNRFAIRRNRLNLLITRYQTQAELAEKIGVSPSYLSQLAKGIKNIGDDCREWEEVLNLGLAWFDRDIGEDEMQAITHVFPRTEDGARIGLQWENLPVDDRLDIARRIRKAAQGTAQPKPKKESRVRPQVKSAQRVGE